MAQVTRSDDNGNFTIKTGTSNPNGQRTISTGNLGGVGGSKNNVSVAGGTGSNPVSYTARMGGSNNTTSYGGSGGYGGGYDNSARINALKKKIEEARASALNSISKSYETGLANLRNNMGFLEGDYQNLLDQNEIERFKTQRSMRENQANRGQLDSGLGRQAMLNTDTRFANANSGILSQREADRTSIKNLMEQMRAEREQKKAEINNQYNNSLMQLEA